MRTGYKHSAEARKKMCIARIGRTPMLGKKLSEEHKQKLRLARARQLITPISLETRRKLSEVGKGNKNCLGRKLSEETKKKLRDIQTGRKLSEETKKKMSEARRGKKLSEEHKKKLSEVLKGKKSPNFGKKHSEETKRKMSEAQRGEKGHNWLGGKSFEPYTVDWTKTLKRAIRERDNYTCRMCKKLQKDIAFSVHHIDYNKKNCNPNNLITLCPSCHTKTNHNRDYWINYFFKND